METQDWRHQAACRGENPELWFSLNPADRQTAQLICSRCPVRVECGVEARATHEGRPAKDCHGMWGDVDYNEHRFAALMRRKAERAADAAAARAAVERGDVCRNGHPQVGDDGYVGVTGKRVCRVCRRLSDQRRKRVA
jgi:WhiB family transcriptional regulator, redox-sensing transcriptional regulator